MEMIKAVQDMFAAKKWRDPNLTGNYNSPTDNTAHIFGDQNQILMRYAEVIA